MNNANEHYQDQLYDLCYPPIHKLNWNIYVVGVAHDLQEDRMFYEFTSHCYHTGLKEYKLSKCEDFVTLKFGSKLNQRLGYIYCYVNTQTKLIEGLKFLDSAKDILVVSEKFTEIAR
jgi:hypothetical protein